MNIYETIHIFLVFLYWNFCRYSCHWLHDWFVAMSACRLPPLLLLLLLLALQRVVAWRRRKVQRMPISFMFNIFMYFSTNAIIFNKLQQPQPHTLQQLSNDSNHAGGATTTIRIWTWIYMYIHIYLLIQLSAKMCIIHSLSLFVLIFAIRAAAASAIGRGKAEFAQRIN